MKKQLMPAARIVAVPIFLVLAGCAGTERVPPGEAPYASPKPAETIAVRPPEPDATQAEVLAIKPPQASPIQNDIVTDKPPGASPAQRESIAAQPPRPEPTESRGIAVVRPAPSPPVSSGRDVAKPDTPAAKTPPKLAATPAPAPAKPAAPAAPAASAAKPSPPLDLPLLEKRLKETGAIGVFTKLTLKNQVDDLLDRFRAYHQGRLKTTLRELRQPYDMLILKVLSLLQDSDPSLATAIASSREAIWGVLSDRETFANL